MRILAVRRGASLIALLAVVPVAAACGSGSDARLPQVTLAKRSVTCGAAQPWSSTGRLVHTQQVGDLIRFDVPRYKAGRPTKVIIEPVAGAPRDRIRLFGRRCSDGTPLRFGFFTGGGGSSVSEEVAARSGLSAAGAGYLRLALKRMLRHGWRESGYVTLTRGKWILQARLGWGPTLASVVFEVR